MKKLIYLTILSMFVFGSFGVMAQETVVTDANGNTLCEKDPVIGKPIKDKLKTTKTGNPSTATQETNCVGTSC